MDEWFFCVFQIWRKYDADSSGFISAAELRVSVTGNCLWVKCGFVHHWGHVYHEFGFFVSKKPSYEFVTFKKRNLFMDRRFTNCMWHCSLWERDIIKDLWHFFMPKAILWVPFKQCSLSTVTALHSCIYCFLFLFPKGFYFLLKTNETQSLN